LAVLFLHALTWELGRRAPELFPWLFARKTPERIQVETLSADQLAALRKQWRTQKERLLISRGQTPATEAPETSSAISDRNIRVAKETRARQTRVLPRPQKEARDETRTEARPATPAQAPVKLSDLGVPLRLTEKPSLPRTQSEATQTQAGGQQYIEDPALPLGGETLLNAKESVYYSFYARLYETIGPIWQSRIREIPYQRRVAQGEYVTVVDLVLNAEGGLLRIDRLQDSGIPEFDAAVQDAWRRVARFPNPPKKLIDEQGEVHTQWGFRVHVGPGFNIDYLPPRRVR
jgi:hypothetical protein